MSAGVGFDRYLSEIGRKRLLTPAEELALARRYRDRRSPEDRERLVAANLRFVVSVARRYRDRGLSIEELVAEGNVGLLQAAERFDAERGVRFVTYAVWWIRRSILAALARSRTARGVAGTGSGRRGSRPHLSLDSRRGGGSGTRPLAEVIPDERTTRPDDQLHGDDLRRAVAAGLSFLPEREARVLQLYYGLEGERAHNLGEVGRELGVSRERARQLRARGLELLRRGPRCRELRSLTG